MNRRVLIVDDDDAVRMIIGTSLELIGVSPEYAVDGENALECITRQPPDLILLDLMMPRMSGFSVLTKLQSDPGLQQVPVVVLTAMRPEDLVELTGVVDVFHKGQFRIKELQTTVTKLLNLNGVEAVPAQ